MNSVTFNAEELEAIRGWSEGSQMLAREVLGRYPHKRSAVMPLLYVSMIENGYVTADGMQSIATLTGLTGAQVQAVASFYSMYKREELGDYLISVCTSISCFLRGRMTCSQPSKMRPGFPMARPEPKASSLWSTLSATVLAAALLWCWSTTK